MWLMLQQDRPGDYVIGTGEAHSVREFVEMAFAHVDLNWRDYVEIDSSYFRPAEVDYLLADPSKARACLGWQPTVTFHQLVRMMVEADMNRWRPHLPAVARQFGAPKWLLGLRDLALNRSGRGD